SGATAFGFAGQYRDSESGLYYLQARYYNSTTGQFLSRDPMVTTTRSPYAYANGDPPNETDPSGMISFDQLNDQQRLKIHDQCLEWNNFSLCMQAALCDSIGQCATIELIAAQDAALIEIGIEHCTSAGVPLQDGYMATADEAGRDLREVRAAQQVA